MVKRTVSCGRSLVGRSGLDGRRAVARVVRGLLLGLMLMGCSIPFGNGGGSSSSERSPEETRRDRNRMYQQEQERYEREMLFDRVGPPSDR